MNRAILHIDMNSFYASVEMMQNPSLKGKAVAVCGSTEDRHGIVLAKSEKAKKAGVKTGMVTHKAQAICPGLVTVEPHYDLYMKYSKLARKIYERYSDQVEPYGLDECWIDVTGSRYLFGDEMTIAESIRSAIREELGLTVSIGVSFNKVFAKLGSDMKKPDAITEITRENFKSKVWPLPSSEMFYVGHRTSVKFSDYGILTIGDIANASVDFIEHLLGKNGLMIWAYANGEDVSAVMKCDYQHPIKSFGHGTTCQEDLHTSEDVWRVILYLSQEIGTKLRSHSLTSSAVQLIVRDSKLNYSQYQQLLSWPSQNAYDIALCAMMLFKARYMWANPVRSLTVRAIDLSSSDLPVQLTLDRSAEDFLRLARIESVMDTIKSRFGKGAIFPATIGHNDKLPTGEVRQII
ncbi:MAG: DNA polymerase IV [Clostridiales bacterium]|nr:DNA polymerase IV [Clostridiales bacterium]